MSRRVVVTHGPDGTLLVGPVVVPPGASAAYVVAAVELAQGPQAGDVALACAPAHVVVPMCPGPSTLCDTCPGGAVGADLECEWVLAGR